MISVDIESHEMFLRKVARRGARLPRTQIFTTNYDLCFEKAASRGRFVLLDGFSLSTPPEFDGTYFNFDLVSRGSEQSHLEFLPNVFQLCKLHGSIDWENLNGVIQKTTNRKSPCIIYPQEGKYESSFSSPYLEIMGRLQNSLRKPNLGLIVGGFGFNDNHISHPIMQALRSNVNMKMLIVDPSIKTTSNSYLNQISKLTSSGDWRVGLLSGTFENFVKFVPDLIKESESEVHFQRVRSAF